jgi:hypothetical protein
MRNLGLKVETDLVGFNDNQDWLASDHGVDTAFTVTLDGAACRAVFPSGVVPSGTPIGELASGLYGPGDAAGTGGHVGAGHLLHTKNVGAAAPTAGQDHWPADCFWHGAVIRSKLPVVADVTDRPHIYYHA